jgi:hypothetical protein
MVSIDIVMLVVLVLTGLWVAPPIGRLLVLGRGVRDDFGDVVPYMQQQVRQQLGKLLLRMIAIVLMVVFLLATV